MPAGSVIRQKFLTIGTMADIFEHLDVANAIRRTCPCDCQVPSRWQQAEASLGWRSACRAWSGLAWLPTTSSHRWALQKQARQ